MLAHRKTKFQLKRRLGRLLKIRPTGLNMITFDTRLNVVSALLYLLSAASISIAQQPQVFRNSVQPNWFSNGDRFWYRVKVSSEVSEFVLVDAKAGTRTPAFDHDRLAKALSDATSADIDAGQLPIDSLTFAEDMSHVSITGKRGSWDVHLSTYQLTNTEPADSKQPTTRFFLPPRKSIDRGGDTQFKVVNQLLKPIELVWVGRDSEQITYHTLAVGQTVAQHTFSGHVWLVRHAGGTALAAFEVSDTTADVIIDSGAIETANAKPEPDIRRPQRPSGRRSSEAASADRDRTTFVRDENLWMKVKQKSADGEDFQDVQLTTDATSDNTFRKDASRERLVEMQYALPDPPVTEPDVRWSPDSNRLVAFQTKKVTERRVSYIDSSPKSQTQPLLESYPYAKPGDPLPIPQPRLFAADDGTEIPISSSLFPHPFKLQFLKWSDDSQYFYLLYNERGHQSLKVLEVSAADGTVRAIVAENSQTFIHYSTAGKFILEWLPRNELLWASERSGWNHIYLYDVESAALKTAVTSGNWNVRRIERLDKDAGVIWFYAVGIAGDQDPYHEHFCKVNLDGSDLKVLTAGDGTHAVTMSPDRRFFLDIYSRVDMAPVTELRRSDDGTLVMLLEAADASEVISARGPLPIRFVAKGRDGQTDIWGIIHLPRYFDANKQCPIVENIYAGPHDHHVPKAFRSSYRHQHQIADRGIVVVQIDGMGTAWRSKLFHDVCFRNLKDAGFPDRIEWIKAAATQHPFMDISRVGIYGGSAGGQNAMGALLWHGTFYKAAVADCGCHDNRMDKIWWNEQWMGWPVDVHYATNSNVENAHLLQGQLMLVVGELDRNVDPASTTQAVASLIKAGKDFTYLLVPGSGHGACERPYGSQRRADFLAKHLRANTDKADADAAASE